MKKIIIYSYGVFDILNVGHIKLLEGAKELGDTLIVGIVSDEAVKKLKGIDRPIQPQLDRARIIESLTCVDMVILQKEFDPSVEILDLWFQGVEVDILVKGNDWKVIPGEETINLLGGKLVKLPYSKQWSTTKIINKIRKSK